MVNHLYVVACGSHAAGPLDPRVAGRAALAGAWRGALRTVTELARRSRMTGLACQLLGVIALGSDLSRLATMTTVLAPQAADGVLGTDRRRGVPLLMFMFMYYYHRLHAVLVGAATLCGVAGCVAPTVCTCKSCNPMHPGASLPRPVRMLRHSRAGRASGTGGGADYAWRTGAAGHQGCTDVPAVGVRQAEVVKGSCRVRGDGERACALVVVFPVSVIQSSESTGALSLSVR